MFSDAKVSGALVLDCAPAGDFSDKIEDMHSEGYGGFVSRQYHAHLYFKQLVEAIKYCHEHSTAYLDVKPKN